MKKTCYELKDVIFGLNEAYQENRHCLDSLKKYVEVDKSIKYFNFYLESNNENETSLILEYYKKAKLLDKLFKKNIDYSDTMEIIKPENGLFYLGDNLNIIDQYSFLSMYDYIINCRFIKSISLQNISSCESISSNLFISPSTMIFDTTQNDDSIKSMIYYNPITNQLEIYYISTSNTPNTNIVLNYLLATRFYKDCFNKFHKEYIDEFVSHDYYIEIDDNKSSFEDGKINKKLTYDIIKEDKQIILSRVKK
ncbi:MAG: hypothetical protein IJ572_04405 [Bacilli bacterium]|nr:hypothetical protein [Bacilli bacterium]